MEALAEMIVLARSECAGHSVHTSRLHHRHFPELWVECESPIAAANHLLNQLVRAMDSVSGIRARESFETAIEEVKAFAESLRASELDEDASEQPHSEAASSIGRRIGRVLGRGMSTKPLAGDPNG
jgi:hypothetical protein